MSGTDLSYSQVLVGKAMVGLIGLQEILEGLAEEGVMADAPGIGARLVAAVKEFPMSHRLTAADKNGSWPHTFSREHNYVPSRAAPQYEAALVSEYRRFLDARASGRGPRAWHDARKEHQPWFPTIFEAKCDGCGLCLEVCPREVLGWNADKTKVLVWQPYECAPACQLCARACPPKAISMPPLAALHRRVESQAGRDPCMGCSLPSCDGCVKGGTR